MNNIIGWIDEQLGRITMYALVFYCLVAMVLMALGLILAGNLEYSPAWFIGGVLVCVGAAYGSNYLFAWLFGTKPHSESALITGLILALLYMPSESALDIVKLSLVAMIAMASKYVIAIGNRHIFNPAAIAIVMASFGGLAFAGWWVATPGMIPVTIIVTILILRRTQKLRLGGLFILVATAALFVQGTSPVLALTSWPLIFVAGIMLSEPLTLPPRAKHQYIEAVLVAVLMTIPFSYARVTMTPALAIVLGNLVGWWFGQRGGIKLRFVGKTQMSASTYDFVFDTDTLHFESGQYLELSLIHNKSDLRGHRRIFSIASKPGEEQINIGTKMPDKPSSFKRALMELKPGTTLYATRIGGDFVLPKDPNVPIVCIAGGIGITPFISFCETIDRPIQLIYSVAKIDDLSYIDTLKQHNIIVTVVSDDTAALPDPDWKHEFGRVDEALLSKLIDVNTQPVVYISGPPAMVMGIRQAVKKLGVKHVKVDEFSGY